MERDDNDEEMIRRLRRINQEDSARNPQGSEYVHIQSRGKHSKGYALVLLILISTPVAIWEGIHLILS